MIGYFDQIDEKRTIEAAKHVLHEYARLLAIVDHALLDIRPQSRSFHTLSFSSYINADRALLEKIERRDKGYEEIRAYLDRIQNCINHLELNEIELINLRYVERLTIAEISKKTNSSERHVFRRLNRMHINFAIVYGVAIKK